MSPIYLFRDDRGFLLTDANDKPFYRLNRARAMSHSLSTGTKLETTSIEELIALREQVKELTVYLHSDKYAKDNMVNVTDVLLRLPNVC